MCEGMKHRICAELLVRLSEYFPYLMTNNHFEYWSIQVLYDHFMHHDPIWFKHCKHDPHSPKVIFSKFSIICRSIFYCNSKFLNSFKLSLPFLGLFFPDLWWYNWDSQNRSPIVSVPSILSSSNHYHFSLISHNKMWRYFCYSNLAVTAIKNG